MNRITYRDVDRPNTTRGSQTPTPSGNSSNILGQDPRDVPESKSFDYESKIWGINDVRLNPTQLNALRLKYCLSDLQKVSGRVIDVGCGGGGMVRAIKFYEPELEVHGCDVSLKALAEASHLDSEICLSQSRAESLPYRDNFFSAALVFDVLEHLQDPRILLSEIHRILQPGGILHAFVPCEGSLYTAHGILKKLGWNSKEAYGGHIQHFSGNSIKTLVTEQGFAVRDLKWSGHLIYQFADVTYFTILSLRGINVDQSVEGYLASSPPSATRNLTKSALSALAAMSYLESSSLKMLPGWGAHLSCAKQ